MTSGPVDPSFITVMNELYDLIRQDYRELFDEIPTDIDTLKLHAYFDGSFIRPATDAEAKESEEQAKHDGGSGVIIVEIDGKPLPCYVT